MSKDLTRTSALTVNRAAWARVPLLAVLLWLLLGGCAATTPGEKYMKNYSRALTLYDEKSFEEVLRTLKPAVVHFPVWAEGSFLYARAARATGTIEGRWLASEVLVRLVANHPERTDIRRELASLYLEQGFYSYAKNQCETLLGLDEEDSSSHYMLALTVERDWRRYHDEKDLSLIIAELARTVELDSLNRDALSRLTLAHLEREQPDSMQLVLDRFLEAFPSDVDALMLSAIALHGEAKYEESLKEWERFFSHCDSVTCAAFNDISLLLTSAQRRKLRRLDEDATELFARVLWKELDPTPTTELNERILEHWRRVGISRALFSDKATDTPGWATGPGQVLIRYGMPESREYTFSMTGPDNLAMPTLVWHYADETGSFEVAFVDYCLSGDFQYFAFSELPTAYDARTYYNPASYEHDYGAEVFENLLASASFSRDFGTREELYLGVPLDKVTAGNWKNVPCEAVVFDTLWNELARISTTLETASTYAEQGMRGVLVRELEFRLAPGRYILALAVADSVSGTLGITKDRLTVLSFPPDALAVSEIELAYMISERRSASGIDPNKEVLPNPSGAYAVPEPVKLYYEVYNLTRDGDGKYRFITRYSIVPLKRKGDSFWGFLASLFASRQHYIVNSFERQVESESTSERLTIDVSALKNGSYRLVLEVEDTVSRQRAETERTFEKVPALELGGVGSTTDS